MSKCSPTNQGGRKQGCKYVYIFIYMSSAHIMAQIQLHGEAAAE